jgi:hypothetical protein
MTELLAHPGPDWVMAEMPPGYQTRLIEIQRLVADLQDMGRFARLLFEVGPPLAEAVHDAFAALKFETELVPGTSPPGVTVRLEGRSRLLIVASATPLPIHKKSPEIAQVFQVLQEVAEEADKVVLVTNVNPESRPADRPPAIAADALAFLVRMGASHLTGPTLFTLWKLSHQGLDRAREQVERLYAHDAGTFELPASLLR